MNRTDVELHRPAFTARSLTQISLSFLKEARLDGIMMDDEPGFCGMRVCFEMQQKDVEKVKDSGFLLEYCRDFIVH